MAKTSARSGSVKASGRPFALSLVVPMHNESEMCGIFFERVIPILQGLTENYEVICVNDGSRDDTLELLTGFHVRNPRIKIVNLSRNFGKEQGFRTFPQSILPFSQRPNSNTARPTRKPIDHVINPTPT